MKVTFSIKANPWSLNQARSQPKKFFLGGGQGQIMEGQNFLFTLMRMTE